MESLQLFIFRLALNTFEMEKHVEKQGKHSVRYSPLRPSPVDTQRSKAAVKGLDSAVDRANTVIRIVCCGVPIQFCSPTD